MFKVPNQYRIKTGPMGSDNSYDNNGAFEIPLNKLATSQKGAAYVIASDDEGWEHVSVHIHYNGANFVPTWSTMCAMKDLFWDDEDCVIQFHPPKSEYVNHHKTTLHLWRQVGANIVTPPMLLVGIK